MWLLDLVVAVLGLCHLAEGSILQNNQAHTTVDASEHNFRTYPADAYELSYKGRWDSRRVSWWS